MIVRRITTTDELAALADDWNALDAGVPLRSWDWLATWWNHYGANGGADESAAGRELYVLAVFDDAATDVAALVGVAPWLIDRTRVSGNVLRWLGSGEVCTDHLSLICLAEDRQRVATAVAGALTSEYDDWDRFELEAVDEGDEAVEALLAVLADRECSVSRRPADACWILDLPASWDEYLATLSKSHRKQLRQAERRVLETGRVRWHRVQTADDLPTTWDVLVDLHQRRRQSLGEPGSFASRPFYEFHREVVDRLLARRALRMSWMELDGTPAAAEYHFAGGQTTYAYQGGVDPERLDAEPGRLSTIRCLQAAIGEGHRHIDFLRGDEPYKAHWRATPRPTFDVRVVPNRRLARLRGRVLDVADTLSDWTRQQVGLVTPRTVTKAGC